MRCSIAPVSARYLMVRRINGRESVRQTVKEDKYRSVMPRERFEIIPNCQTSAHAMSTLDKASMTASASWSNRFTRVRRYACREARIKRYARAAAAKPKRSTDARSRSPRRRMYVTSASGTLSRMQRISAARKIGPAIFDVKRTRRSLGLLVSTTSATAVSAGTTATLLRACITPGLSQAWPSADPQIRRSAAVRRRDLRWRPAHSLAPQGHVRLQEDPGRPAKAFGLLLSCSPRRGTRARAGVGPRRYRDSRSQASAHPRQLGVAYQCGPQGAVVHAVRRAGPVPS